MVSAAFNWDSAFKQGACAGLLCLLCIGFALTPPAQADADALASVEQRLFSQDYAGEPLPGRLERLEISVFGSAQPGSEAQRTDRLIQALAMAKSVRTKTPSALPADPATDSSSSGITRFTPPGTAQNNANPNGFNPAEDGAGTAWGPSSNPGSNPNSNPDSNPDSNPGSNPGSGMGYERQANPAPPPGDSNYPTVTALEREVFSRDFLRDDISRRLDRLEARAFGQNSPSMSLADRVDHLLARYPNASGQVANYTGAAANASSRSALRDLPNDSRAFVGSMDTYTKVGALEKRLLNGKTYDGELLTQRLDRLETQAYGHDFSGQSIDTRVNRLLGGYKTPNKNNFTGNPLLTQPDPAKWQSPPQVGYTGSFLSSSAARPGASNAYSSPYNAPPQNVQIGGGFSSASTSTYNFSPDMMTMLPPGVQQQLGTSTMQQQSSTTVIGAPGTVITQETTAYPNFQTYGAPPITTYNYYGPSGGAVPGALPNGMGQLPPQSTVTVIQPNGLPTVIQNLGATLNGLPNPSYIGDPAVLQGLNNLELNLYGQVNQIEPVPVRLSRLESVMLGQVFMGYPDDQRLGQLQKAYQIQSMGRLLGKGKAANIGRTAGSMLFGVPMTMPTAPTPLLPVSPTH